MAGEINRVPWGLLNLLDMKALGQNPRNLDPNVQGSLDLFPFYSLQNAEWAIGTAGPITTVGGFRDTTVPANTEVPQGELWYCWALTVTPTVALNGPVGAQLSFCPVIFRANYPNVVAISEGTARNWIDNELPVEVSDEPFWMQGGDNLGVLVTNYIAMTVDPTLNLSLYFTRFRV